MRALLAFWIACSFGLLLSAQQAVPVSEATDPIDRAITLRNRGELEQALDLLEGAEEAAEKAEDPKAIIDIYNQYALLYLRMGRPADAEHYVFSTSRRLEDIEYPHGEAVHRFVRAKQLHAEEFHPTALEELEAARALSNERNLSNNILLLEAEVNLALGKDEEALVNYNALAANTDSKESSYLTVQANIGRAEIALRDKRYSDSGEFALAALETARSEGFITELEPVYRLLTRCYELAGDYQRSLQFNKDLMSLRTRTVDSSGLAELGRKADVLAAEHQLKELNELRSENDELKQSANRSEMTAILTSAFLTIISLLAVSLYRNNQIKIRTNDLLHTKNKELETARDAAISAMEAKTNFLSTVTHELRTPLYAVTGLTHLLLEENPADHQKEHLKSLKFSGDYLMNFINDILQINKIDADKLEPLNIEFKLKKVLTDVIDSLQQTASENNNSLILDYDNSIPYSLLGDPLKLSQIFMNLVGNALKFTKDGKVEVIARVRKRGKKNVCLYFEVTDTGIGISEEQQHSIFESFEQGSVQINREYGGTGLGLTIVRSLLGLFDSDIELDSELGVGSSFFFELTLKCEEKQEPVAMGAQDEDAWDFKGLHVLIVEDNKINQVITKKMLAKKEITCDIANNGNEAIDAARNNRYDCILMDIHMPGISGDEATIQIRKFDPDIPIIALTAISMDDSLDAFYAAGCNAVVTKPFKPEVFYQKIGENVFKTRQGAPS